LNISEPEFDTDYSAREEDPKEKKKIKYKQSKKEADVKKDIQMPKLSKLPEISKIPTAELIAIDKEKDSQ
ncbi:17602_t:CDS:2, partial [Cetraspora pellucida]